MKKFLLLFTLALVSFGAFAQSVTVTFTGKDVKGRHVQLDRVVITNLTQNWQETIIYPDTILMMGSTGIDDLVANNSPIRLSQNVPNPFDGVTDVVLETSEAGKVTLEVVDINGRVVVGANNYSSLPAGTHRFRVVLSTAGTYFFTARCGNDVATIKMVNNGRAGENTIVHFGNAMLKNGTKGATDKPFAFGDNMAYIGYATINGTECTSQTVRKEQIISETIALDFDVMMIVPPTVQTDSVSEITATSAVCGGNVSDDGGSAVTGKGICWSIRPNPTVEDDYTKDGEGEGHFYSIIDGLAPGTVYYVRAFATTANGTYYGNEISFSTLAVLPAITTVAVSDITDSTAVCGGEVESDGGVPVTERGVCWNTSPSPTIDNGKTTDGVGVGGFTSNLTGLNPGTTYYVRAYATNSTGTAYGNEVSFKTTAPSVPVVTTAQVTDITASSAICGGTVISDGGFPVTERGVCYSTVKNPTISDNRTSDGSGTGSFISNITGLLTTTYYVRAYATNSIGTGYGEELSFTIIIPDGYPCGTCKDIEGFTYNTVQIGNQCWMQDNLRTRTFPNGDPIDHGGTMGGSSNTKAYWYAPNNESYNISYGFGVLYNWPAAMHGSSSSASNPSKVQGVCPDGWHVPSDAEWTQLLNYVGSQEKYVCGTDKSYVARALAAKQGWNGYAGTCLVGDNQSENNATGFSAVPAGAFLTSHWGGYGDVAYFWSATEATGSGGNTAYRYYIYNNMAYVHRYDNAKELGFSVRCIKD